MQRRGISRNLIRAGALAVCLCGGAFGHARAEEVRVAVAANFRGPLQAVAAAFDAATGHRVTITSGSTGQLFAQIRNGAPFDVLLAADRERPRALAELGLGDPDSIFTYAIGRLALWSGDPERIDESTLTELAEEDFRWFAIAAPDVAPYGAAAKQVLETLGVWQSLQHRIVAGQNVAQTFAWIETGNAELGLVALAQALVYDGPASYRIVPADLHEPIRQEAVLMHAAEGNAAALEFLAYLRKPETAVIIESYGYDVPARAD